MSLLWYNENINPYRYRGYYYEAETGFYYLTTRFYDPELGRFINSDRYVSTGGHILSGNMFAYCFNNPINLIDPTGEAVLVDDLLIAAAITLVIIAGVYTAASSYSTDGSSALAPDLGGPNLYRLDPGRLPSFGKQKLPDIIPDPAPETPKPKKPNALFYPVLLNKPGITVIFSLPLSVNDAIEDVSNGRNVWTETELAARELTIYVGGDYQSGNNELLVRQGKNAFHYHFPGKKLNGKRNGAHIFYGWQAVEAISRC